MFKNILSAKMLRDMPYWPSCLARNYVVFQPLPPPMSSTWYRNPSTLSQLYNGLYTHVVKISNRAVYYHSRYLVPLVSSVLSSQINKIPRLFHEVLNKHSACWYLLECISHCESKYSNDMTFNNFDIFANVRDFFELPSATPGPCKV